MSPALIIILSFFILMFVTGLIINSIDFRIGLESDYRKLTRISTCPDIELKKPVNNKAVLMLHEYAGTPESLRYLGEKLHLLGFDVFIPALPGAAESLEDFMALTPPHLRLWYGYAHDLYQNLTSRYDCIFIIGASLGGTVGLMLAAENSNPQLCGLVTISSPVKLSGSHFRKRFLRNLMIRFSGILSLVVRQVHTGVLSSEARQLINFHGVEGILIPAAIHSQKLEMRKLIKKLPQITVPLLSFHCEGDATVSIENQDIITSKVSSRLLIKRRFKLVEDTITRHHRLVGHQWLRERIFSQIAEFIQLAEMEEI